MRGSSAVGLPLRFALLALLAGVGPVLGAEPPLRDLARAAGLRVGVLGDFRDATDREIGEREFERVVAHGLSWSVIHPQPDVWNFTPADQVVGFAEARGMSVLGMHLVWDQAGLDDAADWVLAIDDPDALRAVLREHAETIHERYAGRIEAVTAVNEPLETLGGRVYQNHFHQVLGADWIAQVFRIAHDAMPGVKLVLNENFAEYFPSKARGLIDLVTSLVEGGVPIDVVGLQTHLLFGEPDWQALRSTMEALGDLGVEVWITELDAPVPVDLPDRLAVQAERTERAVQTCLLVPACRAVVWWGLHDGLTWLDWFLGPGLSPLLFDAARNPKPSYFAVRDALRAHAPRDRSGRRLRVRDGRRSAAGRRLSLTSSDPAIGTDGDPRRLGATLELRNPATAESAVLDLAPDRWSTLSAADPSIGFRYRGGPGDPCRRVELRPGRLEARCRGAGLGFTLDEPAQGALVAELRVDGAARQCFTFGGSVVVDHGTRSSRGGRFLARDAPAGTACAASVIPAPIEAEE